MMIRVLRSWSILRMLPVGSTDYYLRIQGMYEGISVITSKISALAKDSSDTFLVEDSDGVIYRLEPAPAGLKLELLESIL